MGSKAPTSIFARRSRVASNQAIEWLARLRASDVTAEEKAQFAQWLHADSIHKTAFDDATTLWHGLDALPEQTSAQYERRRSPYMIPLAAAATVIVSFVVALTQLTGDAFTTGKGEQRRVVLSDGSTAFLNTASSIEVRFTAAERRVVLVDGEVWFDVAKDANRPFRVVADHATAEAVGTAFVVQDTPGFTRVGVSEGFVKVENTTTYESKLKSILLHQGDEGTFSEQLSREAEFESETALAWRTGWLKYQNVTLGDLITDLNRYVAKPMVINDDDLANTRVGGSVRIQDQEAMLEALQAILDDRFKWSDVSGRIIIITKA